MSLFFEVESAINRIWGTRRERAWWRRLSFTMGLYFLIPFGLAVYAVIRSMDMFRPLLQLNPFLWDASLAFLILLALNKWTPALKIRWKVAAVAAIVSTIGLAVLQGSFTWATKSVFNYSKMYGSIAALPLLCLWILLAWQIILFGTAFAATLESPMAVSLRRRRGVIRGNDSNSN
jgi:membrane protein